MPTIALSQIDVGGPCKITDDSKVIYFDGPVKITPQPVWRAIPSSVGGELDDVLVDLTYKITGTPKSVWTSDYRAILLPSALHSFTAAGARLIGAANRSVAIAGADAKGFTFTRAKLTKMPEVYLGLGKGLYGECEWTGYIGEGKALTDADAFYAENTTAWDASDFPTTHQEQMCTAAWGAVTGFTAMFAEEGFQLSHELKLDEVKQGNVTVDHKVNGYRGMVDFLPQQPTTTQLLTALKLQGSGGGIGIRRSGNKADLVVAGSGISVTLEDAAPRTGEFVFDNKLNRHGSFKFVTAATTPTTRLTFA